MHSRNEPAVEVAAMWGIAKAKLEKSRHNKEKKKLAKELLKSKKSSSRRRSAIAARGGGAEAEAGAGQEGRWLEQRARSGPALAPAPQVTFA
jgi:hypothetical protein